MRSVSLSGAYFYARTLAYTSAHVCTHIPPCSYLFTYSLILVNALQKQNFIIGISFQGWADVSLTYLAELKLSLKFD